ncbi:multiple C2 and transmembrane domain-containing protein 1-like isoform X2 [Ornithodoros turicata]|uniref:multiple C2 and transmembrane domain-containing protein 1-like isoform X2 n=1 Tax=Ornithodoros turicata TaxID=34597 RepID=UPI0031389CD4
MEAGVSEEEGGGSLRRRRRRGSPADTDVGSSPSGSPKRTPRPGRRLTSVLSTLKKFGRLATGRSPKHRAHENNLQSTGRLSVSHPDVSVSDLAALAASSRTEACDDYSVASSVPVRGASTAALADFAGAYYSDSSLHRKRRTPPPSPWIRDRRTKTPPSERRVRMSIGTEGTTPSVDDDDVSVADTSSMALREQLRPATLKEHDFYQLDIHLRCGKNLTAKDACGTSDPYVKFKLGGRTVYRSRTVSRSLEPYWDECFSVPVEDVFQPLALRVYDYDFGLQDDFMGAALIDLSTLELDRPTDILVNLSESGKPDDMPVKDLGYVVLTLTVTPKTHAEREQYFSKSLRLGASGDSVGAKKVKTQVWDSVINIVLVEGRNLLPMDENGYSDPYVRFKLGTEKYKSKTATKTLNPHWLEQFDLHSYPDQPKTLEITVWDKDFSGKGDFMGRCAIDIEGLEPEQTHSIRQPLEDGAGSLFLLITVSGTQGTSSVSDLGTHEPSLVKKRAIMARYGLLRSFTDWDDVGHLIVKVFKAQGLASADIGGKSDPFCVLELVNSRLQTHTEYKTLCPEWNKIFTFKVKDIHSVLELTVYDEDRDKKFEFLGKLAIPLIKIKNGEKKWYALKDRKLKARAKGQILLEMEVVYNPLKACVKTFNPKELKFMQMDPKFKRAVFMRNVTRVKNIVVCVFDLGKFLNSCFLWESVPRSLLAFAAFLVVTYTAELYMLPLTLLLVFLKNFLVLTVAGIQAVGREEEEMYEDDDDDDEDEKDSKTEEKRSLKERLQAVQEATATVQNVLGEVASLGERINNTFNFSVSFLTWLAILVLIIATFILYFVPIRYVIMAWGINKFTKKLRSPDIIPNNEVMDFLSRVPDNEERTMHRELRPNVSPPLEAEKRKKKKTS